MRMLYECRSFGVEIRYGVANLAFQSGSSWRGIVLGLEQVVPALATHPAVEFVVFRGFHKLPTGSVLDESFNPDDAVELARRGQSLGATIDHFPTSVVAFVEGSCSDHALELALQCHWRVASGHTETRLGFYNDFCPCWGASERLPRLVGPRPTASLLARRSQFTAGQALRTGLLDRVWPANMAESQLLALELELRERPWRPRRWLQAREISADGLAAEREAIARQSRKRQVWRLAA